MATTFMNLSLPTPTVTLGPAWASQLNAAMEVVDAHDHSSGKGTTIKTAGLSINADLTFNGYGATSVSYLSLTAQPSSLSGIDYSQQLYSHDGDLWYTNSSGTPVQITAGGSVSPTPGAVDVLEYDTITSNTTLTDLDVVMQGVTSTSSSITVTMPLAASVTAGRLFVIKDFSGNSETYPITIAAAGSDVIDGALTVDLDSNFGAKFLVSDGNSTWSAI